MSTPVTTTLDHEGSAVISVDSTAPAGSESQNRPSPSTTPSAHSGVQHSKAATTWVGVVISALLLIALIIFIAQNSRDVTTRFLGYDGSTSLGVTVLIAAVAGALLTAIPATIRIIQLRHAVKKNAR